MKVGDTIRINESLEKVMKNQGFDELTINSFVKKFVGTFQTAYSIWTDNDTGLKYVTVDLCCEIPFECCDKY